MKPQYRNLSEITTDTGAVIDAGSLWEFDKNQNIMILVDEDEFHFTAPSDTFVTVDYFNQMQKEKKESKDKSL